MRVHLEEKEVKAIMEVSKFACSVTGEKMPTGMELIKTIMNNNNKLCSITPNFFTGDVDVEISSDYMVEATGLYLTYGPILVGMYNSFIGIMEQATGDLCKIVEKYDKPLNAPSERELSEEEMF